jgi:hypothetical protein
MKKDKMFTVFPRTEQDIEKARILEAIINAPKFRAALIGEFENKAQELAKSIMNSEEFYFKTKL